jgi:hypothetical protein
MQGVKSISVVSTTKISTERKGEEDCSSEEHEEGKSHPVKSDHDDVDEDWEFIEKREINTAA